MDRIVSEQRRLRKQLNNELLRRARRVDSSDNLHSAAASNSISVPWASMSRPESDSRLCRQQSPAARFYDVPSDPVPRQRTYKVLRLRKDDIDRANKDKQHRLYPADFAVSCAGRNFCLCQERSFLFVLAKILHFCVPCCICSVGIRFFSTAASY